MSYMFYLAQVARGQVSYTVRKLCKKLGNRLDDFPSVQAKLLAVVQRCVEILHPNLNR